jgi:ABC-type Mn2+/Zn2+ transport system permease subunit
MAAAAVAWLLTIALAGIDPGRWSVEWTVERLALGGAAVAAVRYVGVALGWLLSGPG